MYKCTDCGKEYNNKPSFCDCGNNNFEENGIICSPPEKTVKPELLQAKADLTKEKEDYTYIILSAAIPVFIITAIIGIFYFKNISEQQAKTAGRQITEQETKKNAVEELPLSSDNQEFIISFENELQNKSGQKNQITKQKEQKKIQHKEKKEKPASSALKKHEVQSNAKTPKTNQLKPPITSKAQSSSAQAQNHATPSQNVIQAQKADSASAKKELLQYKIALRNRISSDIDFTKVIGDGSCIITFKINSSGQLTNRAFFKQSDNDSLNDAVYSAVMNNPAYNPPPSGYRHETLKLTVKIYGGRFEVDLS